MATTTEETGRHVALVDIRVPDNVRDLDPEHVKALAGSIGLQGMLVPVVVRNDGEGFELVAGFHRVAAARSLGLNEVPVVIREAQTEDADRAVENITRKQLDPSEEAKAVRAMLERGLTEDGAAQALGWPKQRVTARVKVLELPERAQQLIGEGVIPLAAVDQLRAIGAVAPHLLDAVITYLDDGNAWAAERLTREPGWVLDASLSHSGDSKVFAAYLHSVSAYEVADLRLGKKTEQLYGDAEKLHKQLDRYAYGPPQIRFTDEDVDQARAAGVLIEFERGRPIIVDRPLYRELLKTAIKRTHDDLAAKAASAARDKKALRAESAPADPITLAKRERDAQLRELTDQAHGANTDLGHALIHKLTTVDPTDITVARFFVYVHDELCRLRGYADAGLRALAGREVGRATVGPAPVALVARSGCEFGKGTRPAVGSAAGVLVTSQIAPRHRDTSTGGSYGTGPSPWFRRSRRRGGVSLTVRLLRRRWTFRLAVTRQRQRCGGSSSVSGAKRRRAASTSDPVGSNSKTSRKMPSGSVVCRPTRAYRFSPPSKAIENSVSG